MSFKDVKDGISSRLLTNKTMINESYAASLNLLRTDVIPLLANNVTLSRL